MTGYLRSCTSTGMIVSSLDTACGSIKLGCKYLTNYESEIFVVQKQRCISKTKDEEGFMVLDT